MKQTVNFHTFEDTFKKVRPDNFSYHGLRALFDYLESCEIDNGEELELDVIALCCEYTEDSIDNVLEAYNIDDIEELYENTIVIEVDDDTIIYAEF